MQCWSNFRVEYLKIWCLSSSDRTRSFKIIHWFNHLHFFDPQHSFHRKLWTSTYPSLESYLPTSECCWVREFVKMKIRNLQSLLVCSFILWTSPLTRVEWISSWRSWLASRIQSCVWCLAFTHQRRWCVFWHIGNPWIDPFRKVATTYPFCAGRLFLLCVSLEVFATPTGLYHARMLIHPSAPACTTGPLRVRRRLLWACFEDPIPLATHWLNSCGKGAEEDAVGFTKKCPDIPWVSQISGGLSLRLDIPTERLSIPPGSRKSGKNAGWLGTWDSPLVHCVLIQHP